MVDAGSLADILVKIKANVDGLKAGMREADRSVEYARINLGRLNIVGGQGIALFSRFGITMGELAQVAGLFLIVNQMRQLITAGHDYNVQLEQMVLGIKAVVAANSEITDAQGKQVTGADRLRIAGNAVAEQVEKMKTDALLTTATLQQIVQSFQAAVPPATAIGLSLDETRRITVATVQAAGAIGLPMEQVAIEVREILSGTINMHTRLGKVLNLSNDLVNRWKQQGIFAQMLLQRMDAFTIAGKEAGDTWVGVTSSLQDFREQLTGAAVEPAVELIRRQLIDLRDSLGSVQNGVFVFRREVKDAVTDAAEFLLMILRAGQNLATFTIEAGRAAVGAAQWLNTVTGGTAGWIVQLVALMALGNLTIGMVIRLGSVVSILAQALFSASGAGRILAAILEGASGAGAAAAGLTAAGTSAGFMAANMTKLMSQSAQVTTGASVMTTVIAALNAKWTRMLEILKLIPSLLAGISTWLVTTPAGWAAIATAIGMVAVGYAAYKLITRDTRTEQEKLNETLSAGVKKAEEERAAASGRVTTAKALLEILKDESKKELEIQEAIANAAPSFEELLTYLGQEQVNRAEIIALIEQQIPLLEQGEKQARLGVVSSLSEQVKAMDAYISKLRTQIAEQKNLIAARGGEGKAPESVKEKLLALEFALLKAEKERYVLAQKGKEELEKPKIDPLKAAEDQRTIKAKYDKEEAVRKEALAVQLRGIAEEEALLTKQKELGFTTEQEYLVASMAFRRKKHDAEMEADQIELKAKLDLYDKEGKKAEEKAALKQQFATKAADKESEMRREELKHETQLAQEAMKLSDAKSAARLKATQGELDIQHARLEAAKTLGLLTELEAEQQEQMISRQKSADEERHLREQLAIATTAEKRIQLEADLTKLQADRQVKEIRHEMEVARIKRELQIRAIEDAGTAQQHEISVQREQLKALALPGGPKTTETAAAEKFGTVEAAQAAKKRAEIGRDVNKHMAAEATKSMEEAKVALKQALAEQEAFWSQHGDTLIEQRRTFMRAFDKLNQGAGPGGGMVLSREETELEKEERRLRNAVSGIQRLWYAREAIKARLSDEAADREEKRVAEAEHAIAEIRRREAAKEQQRRKEEDVSKRGESVAVRYKMRVLEEERNQAMRIASEEEERARRQVELDRQELESKLNVEERKRSLYKEGSKEAMDADRQIANLKNQLAVQEIAGAREVTQAHIKAAEARYKATEEFLKKQLDLESSLRSASIESLNLIERYKLSRRLGVSMLELPKKLEELPMEERARETRAVRREEIAPGEFEQAQAALEAGVRGGVGRSQTIESATALIQAMQELNKLKGLQLNLGVPLGEALKDVLTRMPTELTEEFSKKLAEFEGFTKLKDQAVLGFDVIVEKSKAMFSELKTQGEAFEKEFTIGRLPDIVFDNVYARLVKKLETEFSRT